jgi:hypothetical protein
MGNLEQFLRATGSTISAIVTALRLLGFEQKCFTWNIFVTSDHTLLAKAHCRLQAGQYTWLEELKAA